MPLIAALVVLASTPWFLAVLLLVLAVPVWRSLVAAAAEQRELAFRHGLVVAARADRQHAAVLAGDLEVGVYGEYPPVTDCAQRLQIADEEGRRRGGGEWAIRDTDAVFSGIL
jgi:hypothetical protein